MFSVARMAFVVALLAVGGTARAGDAPPVSSSTAVPPLAEDRPRTLDWDQGEPIPAGYTPATEIHEELVIAGAVTLGATWLLGGVLPAFIGLACGQFSAGDSDCGLSPALFAPGVGPFIALPFATDRIGRVCGECVAALLADGLVQNGGAAMMILGLVMRRDVLVRVDVIGGAPLQWAPGPMWVGASGQGFGIVGSF